MISLFNSYHTSTNVSVSLMFAYVHVILFALDWNLVSSHFYTMTHLMHKLKPIPNHLLSHS